MHFLYFVAHTDTYSSKDGDIKRLLEENNFDSSGYFGGKCDYFELGGRWKTLFKDLGIETLDEAPYTIKLNKDTFSKLLAVDIFDCEVWIPLYSVEVKLSEVLSYLEEDLDNHDEFHLTLIDYHA